MLGVSRDADDAEIKKAFRRLARELHPDVNSHDPDAEEKFKEAAEAYEVLSDSDRRATYDRYGHEGLRSGGYAPNFEGFGSVSDIFEAFFGGGGGASASIFGGGGGRGGPGHGRRRRGRGRDHARRRRPAGRRSRSPTTRSCAASTATATAPSPARRSRPAPSARAPASCARSRARRSARWCAPPSATCAAATAGSPRSPCHVCRGRGRKVERAKVSVDVPAGIDDGQRIRITGRGHAGERGGPAGDLYVQIRVREDPRFVRDGDDLVTVVDVAAPLAALGTTVEVPTIDGTDRARDPGRHAAERDASRSAAQGMPALRGRRHGDLRVVVNVVIPATSSASSASCSSSCRDTLTEDNLRTDEGVFGKLRARPSGAVDPAGGAGAPRATPSWCWPSCSSWPRAASRRSSVGAASSSTRSTARPASCPRCPSCRPRPAARWSRSHDRGVADDWAERWREFHRPLVLGDRLTRAPAVGAARGDTELDVVIDPGQAFGTGAHATTRLCLELLLETRPPAGLVRRPRLRLGRAGDRRRQARLRAGAGARLRPGRGRGHRATTPRANGVALEARRFDLRAEQVPECDWWPQTCSPPPLLAWAASQRRLPPELILSGLLATEADGVAAAFAARGLRRARAARRGASGPRCARAPDRRVRQRGRRILSTRPMPWRPRRASCAASLVIRTDESRR